MPSFSIHTVAGRQRLDPRPAPYFVRVKQGCYVGARKLADGRCTFIARRRDETTGRQVHQPLGEFDEVPDHARFDVASKAAITWFDHVSGGGSTNGDTVKDACENYLKHLRLHRAPRVAQETEACFKRLVYSDVKLATLPLTKLSSTHIARFAERVRAMPCEVGPRVGQTRSGSSFNRDIARLRAALNLALDDGLLLSNLAWRNKLRPLNGVDKRRELYLDRKQRKALIEHAPTEELRRFLTGLCLLPLRPGALAGLTVDLYDRKLHVLKVGRDKAGADRKIKLPKATAQFFDAICKGRVGSEPIFVRLNGREGIAAFDKDTWKWPIKEAVTAAKLPEGTTAYTLRHSTISDLVTGGLDLASVATISGTSTKMIIEHYSHMQDHAAVDALAGLVL